MTSGVGLGNWAISQLHRPLWWWYPQVLRKLLHLTQNLSRECMILPGWEMGGMFTTRTLGRV